MMNAAYHYLDLTPLGRHEEGCLPDGLACGLRDRTHPASDGRVLPNLDHRAK